MSSVFSAPLVTRSSSLRGTARPCVTAPSRVVVSRRAVSSQKVVAAAGGALAEPPVLIPDTAPSGFPTPVPATLPPARVFETAVQLGVTKATYNWRKTLMLAFLAARRVPTHASLGLTSALQGCQIGVGGMLMTVVGGGSPGVGLAHPGLGKLLNGAVGLPLALALVIFTGGELFTGNVFYMLAARLSNKVTTAQLALNWAVSFTGNFAGALAVAGLAFVAGTTAAQPFLGATISMAAYKSALPFGVAFTRGLLCNWMVCSAVFVAMASSSAAGKWMGIWFLVSSFVALGFEHSIANMFLIPLGMLNGASVSITTFLTHNLIPVTLGNIAGGGLLIAFGYWYSYGANSPATAH